MSGRISEYFSGIGAKRLRTVEVNLAKSNQHEFNGIGAFKKIFGTDYIDFDAKFIYMPDEEEQVIVDKGRLTWYDARANHPTRSEHRLYYSTNSVLSSASAGDLVIVGRTGIEEVAVIVAPEGSTLEKQLLWLFGLEEVKNSFIVKDFTVEEKDAGYAGKYILSALGFEVTEAVPDFLDELISRFGVNFPRTIDFSNYARSTVPDVSPVDAPDEALLAWLEREEMLFKTLEKHIVRKKLERGFGENGLDVDEFIQFSLSVQNRRKSRAGFAFEHHLAVIFNENGIQYSRGQKTERNNKPDFLFPGIDLYRDLNVDSTLLTMLGVKTTAKDRWRQILAEADRIHEKHLITLEPAISTNQTEEMAAQNLQLIIPEALIETYTEEQKRNLITLADFIEMVREKQTICNG